MSKLSTRDKILHCAHDLFYKDGIRATGINKIISSSGVTKVTFYRHFCSKDKLIQDFLEYRHDLWMSWFKDALERNGSKKAAGLAPLVPALEEWFRKPEFRGCAFINSVAELGCSERVISISQSHKQDMLQVISSLLPQNDQRLGLANAVAIAIDGAIFKAQLDSSEKAVSAVLAGLELLILKLTDSN